MLMHMRSRGSVVAGYVCAVVCGLGFSFLLIAPDEWIATRAVLWPILVLMALAGVGIWWSTMPLADRKSIRARAASWIPPIDRR